jgi:hypothetical protein
MRRLAASRSEPRDPYSPLCSLHLEGQSFQKTKRHDSRRAARTFLVVLYSVLCALGALSVSPATALN